MYKSINNIGKLAAKKNGKNFFFQNTTKQIKQTTFVLMVLRTTDYKYQWELIQK